MTPEKAQVCMGDDKFIVEQNTCGLCRHIKCDSLGHYCSKLWMAVIPDMHVTYNIQKGTCFESRKEKP